MLASVSPRSFLSRAQADRVGMIRQASRKGFPRKPAVQQFQLSLGRTTRLERELLRHMPSCVAYHAGDVGELRARAACSSRI